MHVEHYVRMKRDILYAYLDFMMFIRLQCSVIDSHGLLLSNTLFEFESIKICHFGAVCHLNSLLISSCILAVVIKSIICASFMQIAYRVSAYFLVY